MPPYLVGFLTLLILIWYIVFWTTLLFIKFSANHYIPVSRNEEKSIFLLILRKRHTNWKFKSWYYDSAQGNCGLKLFISKLRYNSDFSKSCANTIIKEILVLVAINLFKIWYINHLVLCCIWKLFWMRYVICTVCNLRYLP